MKFSPISVMFKDDLPFNSRKFFTSFLVICFLLLAFDAFGGEKIPLQSSNPHEDRTKVLLNARTYIGTPYVYGGIGRTGIDCSGLIYTVVLDTTGQAVPRSVRALYKFSQEIPASDLEPGDIVFFQTGNPGTPTHAGFYLGNNQFLHSASAGSETGVIISSLDERYWKKTYLSAGRIFPSAMDHFELFKDQDSVLAEISPTEDLSKVDLVADANNPVTKEQIPQKSEIKDSKSKITSETPYGNYSDDALKKAEQINREAMAKAKANDYERNAKTGNWTDRAQKYLQEE